MIQIDLFVALLVVKMYEAFAEVLNERFDPLVPFDCKSASHLVKKLIERHPSSKKRCRMTLDDLAHVIAYTSEDIVRVEVWKSGNLWREDLACLSLTLAANPLDLILLDAEMRVARSQVFNTPHFLTPIDSTAHLVAGEKS
ncbi:MAG TPA: hypothetical protein PKA63_04180 [Oligoflexia bacterium]|nr:hypothetical protein [Oligoflexia bacterium]HMP47847.1 hypothetical protein [Oligoflexia bacterium]